MSYFTATMHLIRFQLRICHRPHRGDYSAPPDPLAGFKRPNFMGKRAKGKGREM